MRRAFVAILTVALTVALAPSPAAGKVLAKTYGGKNASRASVAVRVGKPRRLSFAVTSRRQERMVVRAELRCVYRPRGPWRRTELRFSAKPPVRHRVPVTDNPRACVYSVTANRHDFAGSMAIVLYGKGELR